MINSEEDAKVQEHYRTLLSYYKGNEAGLLNAYGMCQVRVGKKFIRLKTLFQSYLFCPC